MSFRSGVARAVRGVPCGATTMAPIPPQLMIKDRNGQTGNEGGDGDRHRLGRHPVLLAVRSRTRPGRRDRRAGDRTGSRPGRFTAPSNGEILRGGHRKASPNVRCLEPQFRRSRYRTIWPSPPTPDAEAVPTIVDTTPQGRIHSLSGETNKSQVAKPTTSTIPQVRNSRYGRSDVNGSAWRSCWTTTNAAPAAASAPPAARAQGAKKP